MENTKKERTAESLLLKALQETNKTPSKGDLNLLISGYLALKEREKATVNQREIVSIKGLISYTVYFQKVSEELVIEALLARCNARKVEEIPANKYEDAIHFLVDFQGKTILN